MLSVKQFDSCTVKRMATSIFQSPQVNIILHSYPILSSEMILVDVSDTLKHLFLHGGFEKKKKENHFFSHLVQKLGSLAQS